MSFSGVVISCQCVFRFAGSVPAQRGLSASAGGVDFTVVIIAVSSVSSPVLNRSCGVCIRKAHALGDQSIKVQRAQCGLRVVALRLSPAQVVEQDEDDIRSITRGFGKSPGREQRDGENRSDFHCRSAPAFLALLFFGVLACFAGGVHSAGLGSATTSGH